MKPSNHLRQTPPSRAS